MTAPHALADWLALCRQAQADGPERARALATLEAALAEAHRQHEAHGTRQAAVGCLDD